MRNIQFNAIGECISQDCRFRSDCAQHRSAGDYRCDDGLAPNVYKEETDETFWCDSFISGEFCGKTRGFTNIIRFLKK